MSGQQTQRIPIHDIEFEQVSELARERSAVYILAFDRLIIMMIIIIIIVSFGGVI